LNHTNELTILQINDTHAYLDLHPELFWEKDGFTYRMAGGYARLATLIKRASADRPGKTLLLDNGDTLHGTYPAVATKGQALVPILNRLGLESMTAHWEFAYGPEELKQRAAELNYPILALNVKQKETNEPFFPAHAVKTIGGIQVGIIGLASNIVDKTMPESFSRGLSFATGREELPAAIEALKDREKVDLVILLSHLGFPQDMLLLSEVPGVDVCLSGHTHNRLYRPVKQGRTLVIQSGSHGSFLGRLDLVLEDRKVVDYRHELITVEESIEPDPEIGELVRQAAEPYRFELSEVVGETLMPVDRGLNLETTMDNLLLLAIQESTGAQLAFSNGWRYGAPILPGQITLNDLYNIIPMDPPLSTVELTGAEVLEMLEENLEHTYSGQPFRQMGGYVKRTLGLKVYFRVENPRGERIQKIFVGGEEVKADRVYQAVFVTEQGVPAKYGMNRVQHEICAIQSLKDFLARHSPVNIDLFNTFVLV
jgi:2',3'-cyclic-nucleotide 2'-phosphodiesterase (5'-nucleotidase family)